MARNGAPLFSFGDLICSQREPSVAQMFYVSEEEHAGRGLLVSTGILLRQGPLAAAPAHLSLSTGAETLVQQHASCSSCPVDPQEHGWLTGSFALPLLRELRLAGRA